MDDRRVLTAERVYAGVIAGVSALVAVAVIGAIFRERAFNYVVFTLAVFGVNLLVVAYGQRRCRVELGDDGLRVTGAWSGRDKHYRWAELLEVGFTAPPRNVALRIASSVVPGFSVGFTVLVRPAGGRFEVPGPNAPAAVATLPIFGAQAAESAGRRLREACDRHGVPFSERGLRMLDDAPPGSPLRDRTP